MFHTGYSNQFSLPGDWMSTKTELWIQIGISLKLNIILFVLFWKTDTSNHLYFQFILMTVVCTHMFLVNSCAEGCSSDLQQSPVSQWVQYPFLTVRGHPQLTVVCKLHWCFVVVFSAVHSINKASPQIYSKIIIQSTGC